MTNQSTESLLAAEEGDPIGEAILDYLKDGYAPDIIVNSDTMESDVIPVDYLFRNFEAMPSLEQTAITAAYGRVLDVGAGSGCHSLACKSRGLEVQAIDTSKGAVLGMQQQGLQSALLSNIYEYSLSDKDQGFDTILLLMNGVGVAGTLENIENLLKKLSSLLNPKGQILLDSSDLIYLYLNIDGSLSIPLGEQYYGEVNYLMEYKHHKSSSFPWVFADTEHLKIAANNQGLEFEIVQTGHHYDFLARLTMASSQAPP